MNAMRIVKIDSRTVDSIQLNDTKSDWLILRDSTADLSLEHLSKALPQTRFTQLGFITRASEITFDPYPNPHIFQLRESNYPHTTEVIDLYFASVKREFIQPWRDYVGPEISKSILRTIEAELPNTKIYIVLKSETPAGMMSLFPASDCIGNPVTQVGWIWIESELPKNERRSIQSIFAGVLRGPEQALYQAGIHIRNVRSQKFFQRLGFRPVCAHVYLR